MPKVEKMKQEDEMAESEPKLPPPNISRVKNKQVRAELFRTLKRAKRKEKMEIREVRQREAKALGKNAPPKQVPKTIENMRVKDETMVDPADEEVMNDEAIDELSSYFRRETPPKILLTTCDRPRGKTLKYCFEMARVMPNCEFKFRRGFDLKKVIPKMIELNYTHIIVVNEDQKEPNVLKHMNISHENRKKWKRARDNWRCWSFYMQFYVQFLVANVCNWLCL